MWLKSRRTNIHVKRSDLRPSPRCSAAFLRSACPWPCRTAASRWRLCLSPSSPTTEGSSTPPPWAWSRR
ncbi:MAG: hypothetical protein ACLU37_05480 [Collinsella sp.]